MNHGKYYGLTFEISKSQEYGNGNSWFSKLLKVKTLISLIRSYVLTWVPIKWAGPIERVGTE